MTVNKEIINKLRNSYGDAFYLLDSEQFKKNFLELKDSFSIIYPNFNIAYSYKTNYTPHLCKIVNDLGGYAEVVSEMELELALKLGINPKQIIWNGPIKNPHILEHQLISGVTVNIDSFEELECIIEIANRNKNTQLNIGIRCNYDVGDGVISRFGFDTNSDDFNKAVIYTTKTNNIKLINFQCHFAKRQVQYWPLRAKKMIELIDRLGVIPERIDIGGGLYGKMPESLKSQFNSEIPDYNAYAQAAATLFANYFKEKSVYPELIIEPGTALIGDCMKFISTIKTIKKVRGKWFATVLGSQKNINMSEVNPPLELISMGEEQQQYDNLDFVGYTCIEGDILYHNFSGKIAHNDVIMINNCGSYSIVMKPPFILPNFPILDILDNNVQVVKRGECFNDIFQTYKF